MCRITLLFLWIETGAGNVHIYIDSSADFAKALPILVNAKTQRVGVCNAAEKLLVHAGVAADFYLPPPRFWKSLM